MVYHGQYVTAEYGGGGLLVANRTWRLQWETFEVSPITNSKQRELRDKDRILIQAHNGQFVCAEYGGGGPIVANRSEVGDWEAFTLIKVSSSDSAVIKTGDQVALQVHDGRYICAESGGGRELMANRASIKEWETFKIELL